MSEKPRDILEFLRRADCEPTATATEPPAGSPLAGAVSPEKPAPQADSSGGLLVSRRQMTIAGVAAGLLALLTFLIGLAWSGGSEPEEAAGSPVGIWTIKAIEYDATSNGEIRAKSLAAQLGKLASDEVTVQRLDRDRKLMVTVGSWLKNPKENEKALKLLRWVQEREVNGRDRRPFEAAYFCRIKR